ncbi:MAG: extracellular solute-binding protein [Alphaproteobacteria bacterium]|nr:extracellular solute-binding protein [Alphaproteobacteria bacterium]
MRIQGSLSVAFAAAFACQMSGTAAAQTTITMNATELGPMKAVFEPHLPKFERENNVRVNIVAGLGAPTVTMARNKEVDVLITDPVYSYQMQKEKLLVPLDKSKIPNMADLYPVAAMDPYQVGLFYGSFGVCYLPGRTGPIENWSDLWRNDLKGRVSIRSYRVDSISLLVTMAKLNGGDERKPDAGFKKMAELAPSVAKYYENWGDLSTLFRTGQVWASTCTNGRANWLATDQNLPVKFVNPKPGGFALIGTLQVVAGRPNTELSMKLVNFLLSPEIAANLAKIMNYGTANSKAVLEPEIAARVPHGKDAIESLINVDWEYIDANNRAWEERWSKEVAFR